MKLRNFLLRQASSASPADIEKHAPSQYALSKSKRLFDVSLSSLGLALSSPFVLIAAILYRILPRQQGFILRRQSINHLGQVCHLRRIALSNDNSLAALLRAIGIEDCLLLWSVLMGDLSLVGPRMRKQDELAQYNALALGKPLRYGLVCIWWLRKYGNIDFGEELDADMEYAKSASLKKDVAIILRALFLRCYGKPAEQHPACQVIAGIRLVNLSMDNLLSAMQVALSQKLPTKIAFVNADCVNIAAHDSNYMECLQQVDWVCADGIGMKIAGQLLKREIRQNINGTDLFPPLCAMLTERGHSIFLLGAQPGVTNDVIAWLAQHYPQLRVAGHQHGYFDESQSEYLCEHIRASQADVLLVAMGAPKQEVWLQQYFAATGASICMGVGGLFDFYSGRKQRAPIWMRELGCEWLYRLLLEPGRMWRRYLLGNAIFIWRVLLERRRDALAKRAAQHAKRAKSEKSLTS